MFQGIQFISCTQEAHQSSPCWDNFVYTYTFVHICMHTYLCRQCMMYIEKFGSCCSSFMHKHYVSKAWGMSKELVWYLYRKGRKGITMIHVVKRVWLTVLIAWVAVLHNLTLSRACSNIGSLSARPPSIRQMCMNGLMRLPPLLLKLEQYFWLNVISWDRVSACPWNQF